MTYTTTFRTLVTLCSLFFALTASSQAMLVPINAEYQYYDLGNEPQNDEEDNSWFDSSYNSNWSSFEGPLGYGAGDHNEILDPTANTVYFRHQFNIKSTEDFDLMFFNLYHNDGTIVYVNGTKVWTVNMPSGNINYTTNALSNVGDLDTAYFALPHLLVDGLNTLAVEVHNSRDRGDDVLSFGFELIEYHEVCEQEGQSCTDNNPNTINDTINADCQCVGHLCDIQVEVAEERVDIYKGQPATLEAFGGTSYLWSTGETTSMITVNTPSTTGYLVTAFDDFGCSDDTEVWVHIMDCEATVDVGQDVTIQLNDSVILTATEGESYSWSTGEVTRSIEVSPTEDTNYEVMITDEFGCYAKDDVNVFVNVCKIGAPCDDDSDGTYDDTLNEDCECVGFPCHMDVEVTGDDFILPGETATIVAEGGITYIWDHGAVGPTVQVSPGVTTTYTVTIIDTNGCEDIRAHTVVVADCVIGAPCDDDSDGTYDDTLNEDCECVGFPCHMDVEVAGDDFILPGETATMVAEGGITYIWDHGAVGPTVQVSPDVTTTYTVTIIDTNGCEDIRAHTVVVADCVIGAACDDDSDGTYDDTLNEDCECVGFPCHMDVEVAGDDLVSPGQAVTIVAEGGITYIWDNGAVGPVIQVSPNVTTTYTVTIIDANGCQEIISHIVTVDDCMIGAPCDDGRVNTYGDVIDEDCRCTGFECSMDIEITGENEIIAGESTTLVAEGGVAYEWSNGMTGSEITVSPDVTTNYTVIIMDANGCGDVGSFLVSVTDCTIGIPCNDGIASTYGETIDEQCNCVGYDCSMDIEVVGDGSIIVGQTATITAEGGVVFEWNNGMRTSTISVSPTTTTNYSVIITDANGCVDVGSFLVVVLPLECLPNTPCDDNNVATYGDQINDDCECVGFPCHMDIELTGDTEIYSGQTVTLVAEGGVSFSWSNGMQGPVVKLNPTTTTNYTVTITNSNGCEEEATVTISVLECDVQASGLEFYSIVEGQTETLAVAGGVYYEWSTGETTSSIEVTPPADTSYSVTVFDNEFCFEVLEIVVQVLSDPACDFGTECDDNDPLTSNDRIDENCDCVGLVCDVQASGLDFYSIVSGQTETLSVAGGAYYEWSTGETTSSIEVTPSADTSYNVSVFDNEYCFEVLEIAVQVLSDPACDFGTECDDNDPLTINDAIDADCNCVGEASSQDEGINAKTETTGTSSEGTSENRTEGQGTAKEDCTPITSFFPQSKLKHYGESVTISQYEFANLQSGVSFTISGITAKLVATEKNKYIDVVDVSYINESGQEVSYGTFSGESINEVEVSISENIQKLIISLSDGYDGTAPKINVSLGNISSCSINRQGATAQNSGLQAAQQELIELSLQSNLVNGRLMLNIDNPNASSQPIYAVVFDVNGVAVIPDAYSGEVLPGLQSEYIDITSLRPGLYYLRTQVGRQTITLEFVVAE